MYPCHRRLKACELYEKIFDSSNLCTRGSLMTQFTNLDIEKNLQYILTSNKMKLSKNDQGNTQINTALLNMY